MYVLNGKFDMIRHDQTQLDHPLHRLLLPAHSRQVLRYFSLALKP